MSEFQERIKRNIKKLEEMIGELDEKLFNLMEMKAFYEEMLETDTWRKRVRNYPKKARLDRVIYKLHKEFYKRRSKK